MVELRKRKAPVEAPAPPAKKANSVKGIVNKAKSAIAGKKDKAANGSASAAAPADAPAAAPTGAPTVGSVITLDGFGGEVETNDGEKTTLKQLVEQSTGGVVLFTYPKASTPGCTAQACLFRDEFTPLTATGFAIYGLSKDSPKANTTFKTKQNLPYTLLCDPSSTLIGAIGMKKATSTTRGVFVVDKEGKVLAAEAGSPTGTVEVVKKLVVGSSSTAAANTTEPAETSKVETAEPTAAETKDVEMKEDVAQATTAADVADTAEKLDAPVAA